MISRLSKNFTAERSVMVLFASVFIAIAANLSVPWNPVPFTFQTTAVLLVSAILGSELGAYSVLAYLIEGCVGLPVFANFSSGVAVILGPTGGYLLGFLPAAYVAGVLFQKSTSLVGITFAVLMNLAIVFLCGYLQLSNFVGFRAAYVLGVIPFIVTETLKTVTVVFLINKLKKC